MNKETFFSVCVAVQLSALGALPAFGTRDMFGYHEGWIGADVAGPDAEGRTSWAPNTSAHSVGITPSMVKWLDYPSLSFVFNGHAQIRLPGVNSLEDGMLFANSIDDQSPVEIVGVAPADDGRSWLVTIRSATDSNAENLAPAVNSEFEFLYLPFDAQNLIGGHIVGSTGEKRKSVGTFTITRTGTGVYELTIPGKAAADGTLLLQAAEFEAGTFEPTATRATAIFEHIDGKWVIRTRKAAAGGGFTPADASFYFAWLDNTTPLAPEAGVPAMQPIVARAISVEGQVTRETMVAASSHAQQVLVTYVDTVNSLGLTDPITQVPAGHIVVGRFHDSRTLSPLGDPFAIVGSAGQITKLDVKYNSFSRQYVVVTSGRAYNAAGRHVPLMAIVAPAPVGEPPTIVRAWAHDEETDQNYDDVSVAVSPRNGNFVLVAERAFAGEGEGTVAALYDSAGTRLTPAFTRVDLLQQVGDEDDPDVAYLPAHDKFLYVSNTDNSNGSTGTLANRIVGSLIDTEANNGNLVVRTEEPLGNGGNAEGHPAAIWNPFANHLITAYDRGNSTSLGDLSYYNIGPAPDYDFFPDRDESSYLNGGTAGDPFRHQHPQLAVDFEKGIFVVGMNAINSTVNLPNGWAFVLLGPDGLPLPSPLGAPYYLAETTGIIDTGANYHTVVYSPVTKNFIAAYNSSGVSQAATFEVTTSFLAEDPELNIELIGNVVAITWPANAIGYELQSTDNIASGWGPAGLQVNPSGQFSRAETPASGTARFFRLFKP